MSYLIDGHNLIPKLPGLSLSSIDDEQELIARLQVFCRQQRKSVEVFFDQAPPGYAGERSYGRVRAHFVARGRSADEAIRLRLKQLGKAAQNWGVVSSDHQVQAEARNARAQVIPSEEFARELPAGKPPTRSGKNQKSSAKDGLSPEELKQWLEMFGEEGQNKEE